MSFAELFRSFRRLGDRVFTAAYLERIHGVDGQAADPADVDRCVRMQSDLCMSPPRLASFVSLADPQVLAGVHLRYQQLIRLVRERGLHASMSLPRSDGALWRAFLVDIWQALLPAAGGADAFVPDDFPPDDSQDPPPWDE
jgi:hypothetical protein